MPGILPVRLQDFLHGGQSGLREQEISVRDEAPRHGEPFFAWGYWKFDDKILKNFIKKHYEIYLIKCYGERMYEQRNAEKNS